jgi:hypothetical protein
VNASSCYLQFGAQALVQDDLKTFLRVDGGKTPELIFHRKDFLDAKVQLQDLQHITWNKARTEKM